MIRINKQKVNKNAAPADYRATRIVSVGTMTSRVLGVVREQVVAYLFGASAVTDAFVAAFRIPNLLRDLFAEGALSAAFIPTFTDLLKNRGPAAAVDLYQRLLFWVSLIVGCICIGGVIFAPQITLALAAGFETTPGKMELTISLARVMFPFLLFVSLAALTMGALNSYGRFGPPAFAPLWFNIAIIVCAVVGGELFAQPVYGLALGVVLGGLFQWLFQVHYLRREGCGMRWKIGLTPEVKKISRLLLPAIGGLAAVQINIFVITRVASGLGDGPVSYLNFAFRLIFVPLGVFAVAAATVGLPRFSERVAAGDTPGALVRWRDSLKLVWYLVIPAAVIFVVFGEDICRLLFQRGAFLAADTQHTASALAFYALGLPAMATIRVTAPVFYAHKDTRTPVILSFFAVVANLVLIHELADAMSFRGLALALALAATIQAIGLLTFIRFRYGPYNATGLAGFFLFMTVFATLTAVLARKLVPVGEDMLSAVYGLGAIFVAVAAYLLVTWLLKYREARFVFGRGKRANRSD
jgi:putative peptidoglycan lipid II flippase